MNVRHFAIGAAGALLVALLLALCGQHPSLAQEATPAASSPTIIASEVLGRAQPAPVDSPELSLARVTIMPGAAIPAHHHPGTQIGFVAQGTLTYAVYTGTVLWYRATESGGAPQTIVAGETVKVAAGDTLVESPDSIHQGRNEGTVPVVIYLSTLFPEGAPRSIASNATPAP